MRACFALLVAGLAVLSLPAADPAGIPADKLKQAEATYAEVFGAAHEKLLKTGKPAEKADFSRKLVERSKDDTVDPALREVLQRNALLFVGTDPASVTLAIELNKALLVTAAHKGPANEKVAEWTERSLAFAPMAERAKVAEVVVKTYRAAAAEYEKDGQAMAAVAANTKARNAARKYTPMARDTFAALDADDRRLQPLAAEQQEFDKLKAAVEKSPDDAKARLALGLAHLKARRLADAAEQFADANADEWIALGKTLVAKPPATADALADASAKAAALLADDKKGRMIAYQFAVQKYEEALLADDAGRLRPAYIAALEKAAALDPPAQAGRHSLLLAQALVDLADDLTAKKDPAALATLGKARAALKAVKVADAKDLLAEIDAAEKAAKGLAALEADAAKYAEEARTGVLDGKTGLVYGLAMLRLGKQKEAAVGLAKADGKLWPPLAKLLADSDAAPLAVGDALRAAAADLKGDEKTALLVMARERYEQFLADAPKDAPERTRIGLLAKELPTADAGRSVRKPGDTLNLLADPAVAKWFQDGTPKETGTVEFRDGGRLIAVRGQAGQCAIPADRQLALLEAPAKPNEARFVGFWYKKQDGASLDVTFRLESYPQVTYGAVVASKSADTIAIPTAEKAPTEWQFVVRDLFTDFGRPGKVTVAVIGNRDTGTSFLGPIIFGKTAAAVRAAGLRAKPR